MVLSHALEGDLVRGLATEDGDCALFVVSLDGTQVRLWLVSEVHSKDPHVKFVVFIITGIDF